MLFINPFGERKTCRLALAVVMLLVLLAFGVFSAAMFAEPAVTNIEEVIGLSQNGRVFGSAGLNSLDRHFPLIAYGSYVSYQVPE